MITDRSTVSSWRRFWRGTAAYIMRRTPMRDFGELLLRPATIARRGTDLSMVRGAERR